MKLGRAVVVLVCVAWSVSAFADEEELFWDGTSAVTKRAKAEVPTKHYTEGSVSLLSGTGLSLTGGAPYGSSGMAGLVSAGSAAATLGLGADARFVYRHFLVDLGFGAALGVAGSGSGGTVLVPSLGLGGASALGDTIAMSPMVRGTVTSILGSGAFFSVVGEVPLTIFVGRNGFMEPYVAAGVLVVVGQPMFTGSIGYRLGVTF